MVNYIDFCGEVLNVDLICLDEIVCNKYFEKIFVYLF